MTVGASYKYSQAQPLTVGNGAEVAFPTVTSIPTPPSANRINDVSKIFVQAHPGNSGIVAIGKTGVTYATGVGASYYLSAGQNAVLATLNPSELFAIASAAGQLLIITYLQGEV
jgi:hypothetical protein